jgi:hypothetical protein
MSFQKECELRDVIYTFAMREASLEYLCGSIHSAPPDLPDPYPALNAPYQRYNDIRIFVAEAYSFGVFKYLIDWSQTDD